MTNILNIENLTCGYESKFNIRNISFSVKKGTFTGIIGPNGSGKTTLFRGIAGSLKPKAGKMLLNEKNLVKLSYKEKAQNIAIVTQNIETSFITVEDYVLMGRLPYHSRFTFFESKKDYEIANKYMKLTNTLHLKDKFMTELSGG
ncbi:MAG: ABC transporter ATP-binding protein, partial [Bacteroidetes bacterium]